MQELAIASVPMQQYHLLYPPQQALWHGTLFQELEKPLMPLKGGAHCEECCAENHGRGRVCRG